MAGSDVMKKLIILFIFITSFLVAKEPCISYYEDMDFSDEFYVIGVNIKITEVDNLVYTERIFTYITRENLIIKPHDENSYKIIVYLENSILLFIHQKYLY